MILAGPAFLRLVPAPGWNKPVGYFSVIGICLSWFSHLGFKSHWSGHFFLFLDKTVPDSPRYYFTEDYWPEDHCLDVQGAEESASKAEGLLAFWTIHLCCLKKARPGGGYSACRFCIHKCNTFPSVTFNLSELFAVSGINSIVIMDSDLRKHTFCTPYENDCWWLICNKAAWQGSALRFTYSCLTTRLWDVEQ